MNENVNMIIDDLIKDEIIDQFYDVISDYQLFGDMIYDRFIIDIDKELSSKDILILKTNIQNEYLKLENI